MLYFIKTPWLIKKLYSAYIWDIPTKEKILYFTFDDGPHPLATPFVLHELKKYNAKATFFCIGKNVMQYPDVYNQIINEQHTVGNHTHNHLNGWNTNTEVYIDNVRQAKAYIKSGLFRPPYGRITGEQAKLLIKNPYFFKIIMWDVLSADFDTDKSAEKCIRYVLNNTGKGSIIVFHDSEKAFNRLQKILPFVLDHFYKKGFRLEAIPGMNK